LANKEKSKGDINDYDKQRIGTGVYRFLKRKGKAARREDQKRLSAQRQVDGLSNVRFCKIGRPQDFQILLFDVQSVVSGRGAQNPSEAPRYGVG